MRNSKYAESSGKMDAILHVCKFTRSQNFQLYFHPRANIAERAVPDSEPVPVQRGDGAFISSGFSPECISLCVVVSESTLKCLDDFYRYSGVRFGSDGLDLDQISDKQKSSTAPVQEVTLWRIENRL